jgi:hypothetical protein
MGYAELFSFDSIYQHNEHKLKSHLLLIYV